MDYFKMSVIKGCLGFYGYGNFLENVLSSYNSVAMC